MLFNSLEFVIFFPIVFLLYWTLVNKLKLQNVFLLIVSYIFYGWWDWRFLSLIIISSFVDFFVGQRIQNATNDKSRKFFLMISIFVNLGILGFFKYFNFFIESFCNAFTLLGHPIEPYSLNLILPVGISFYTFQTLSYSIDIYRKNLKASEDIVSFFSYVSFFPQLVAGPIERATQLLPQFYTKRKFEKSLAIDGLRQILWGLFKKVVIADNCAEYANMIFNNSADYSGSTLLLGALFFTFQIYGDFSGYSDIAIGVAKLLGFNLMKNFAFPYFSRDIAEFWRRWHISLSTWFRDYLYIPLGGSRVSKNKQIRNTFIIFIVSGFWHGANWTFIFWGFLNALYFLPLLLTKKNRKNLNNIADNSLFPSFSEFRGILFTFLLTVLAWIFFRAENLSHAFSFIGGILSSSLFTVPELLPGYLFLLITFFLLIEWLERDKDFALQSFALKYPTPIRWTFYYGLLIAVFYFGDKQQDFIYFQF